LFEPNPDASGFSDPSHEGRAVIGDKLSRISLRQQRQGVVSRKLVLLLSPLFGLVVACAGTPAAGSGSRGSSAGSAGTSSAMAAGGSAHAAGAAGALGGGSAGTGGAAGDPDESDAGPTVVDSLASDDDFNTASDQALARLGALYDPNIGQWTTGPRWSWANDVEASLASYERSGGLLAPYLFTETYDLNLSKNFLDDLGYDDEAWWANAWVRAFDVTGDPRYLAMAKTIFADMLNAWDPSTCQGGVWWNRNRDYKNAITNELFILLAANLHDRTPGDTDYLSWATKAWAWFSQTGGMIDSSGLVDDGLTTACKSNGQTTWTYNQGIVVGALVELFNATSDTSYLQQAQKLADASTTHLITSGGILQEPCEPAGNCNDDQSNFKGIYQRHLLRLFDAAGTPAYGAFLYKNAHSVLANDRAADGSLGNLWAGPFDESDAQRQNSGLQALHAEAPPWTRNLPFLRAAGGASFNHAMGRPVGPLAWRCDPASCPSAGSMQDGPFVSYLPAGSHIAHFGLTASRVSSAANALADLEVRDETAGSALATLPVLWSDFHAARVVQDFAVPYSLATAGHTLSFRVLWQAAPAAPALTVSDVAVDQAFAFSAANLTHDCGRLDAFQNWAADRARDVAACTLASGPGVALPPGHATAHFELKVDNFELDDERVSTLAVIDRTTGVTAASRDLTRKNFQTALFQDFALEFTALPDSDYDLAVTWQKSAAAPKLTLRGVYVAAAQQDASISLPFDTRGVGTSPADGSIDAVGSVFAAQWLGSTVTAGGHSFTLGSTAGGALNAVSSNGQSIPLPAKAATELQLLLFAINGTQTDVSFVVRYADDSTSAHTRSVSDWVSPAPAANEAYAVAAPFRWAKTGEEYGNFHIFRQTLPLDRARVPAAITLPANPNVKVFAATLVTVSSP
jgi:Glycosyl hydrolase family 76